MQRAQPGGRPVASHADTPMRPHASSGKKSRSITFVDYSPAVDALDQKRRRKDVRKHAATASAAARKATIARRAAIRFEQSNLYRHGPDGWYMPAMDRETVLVMREHAAVAAAAAYPPPWALVPSPPRPDRFGQLVEYVTELQGDRVWYLGPVERTSLAHKAMRSNLVDAMTNSTTLFQAALFVAGTHSNTCGIPSHARHLGVGLILLRGASLGAIHDSIVAANHESLIPVAIAMLAGWERRFGDQDAFEVHMQAWRSLALPAKALDENHVSTLTDLVLESFRENLDERAEAAASGFRITAADHHHQEQHQHPLLQLQLQHRNSQPQHVHLPQGFHVFHTGRAEARSLLDIVAQTIWLDPRDAYAIARLRRLGLENMAWSPTHTVSVEPAPPLEDSWDAAELNALYHVRAAVIAVGGLLLRHSMHLHGVPWPWDVDAALGVHTVSCQHLRTEALLATPYRRAAVWTRFLLCAVFRDPPRDTLLRRCLRELELRSWEQLRRMLAEFWLDEPLIGKQCHDLFSLLVGSPDPDDREPSFTELGA